MTLSDKREMILKGNLYRIIMLLSFPIMLNNLIQTFYNLTDTYFVSRLGSTEVAAIQFIWPLIFFIISIGTGLSMAATTMISQYIGSKDYQEASKVAGQLIYFTLTLSIFVGGIGFFLSPIIIHLMGGSGDLFLYANQYLRIMFLGSFSHFMLFAFTAIKHGQGDMKTPMKLNVLAVLTNIILDPIFMFTLGLGVPGAAIATVLSRIIFSGYGIYYLIFKDDGLPIDFNQFKFNKTVIGKLFSVGMPTALGQSMTSIGFAVLMVFIISFGEDILAAFAIGNRISSLVFLPAMGIGTAISTIVGQNLGADNIDRVKETVKKSLLVTTLITVIAGTSLFFISENLVRIFTDDPYILKECTAYMRLTLMTLPLMGFYQVFIGVFIGSGHTIQSMFIMIGRLWLLRIPMIVLFKHYTDLGPTSVWYAMILSNLFIDIAAYLLYRTGRWQKKIIKKVAA
jgi:putative MATE family efflux protein